MSGEEWEKVAGVVCPSCGKETLQLIGNKCRQCYRAMVADRESRLEERAEKRHVKSLFLQGKISRQDLKTGQY